jgi:DNA-binding NarL/FixJ family response regulator
MFDREPGFEEVAQAGSLEEARGALEGIDFAVVDLDLPDGDGTEMIGSLRAFNPRCPAMV